MLECKTYRYRGHSEADPTRGMKYRTGDEIVSWEEKCPIKLARTHLIEKNWITDAELVEIENNCTHEIDEAVAFAKNSPDAPAEWALTDVFSDE